MLRAEMPYCPACNRSDTVHKVETPYAAKLFTQELEALLINMQLKIE